MRRCFPRRPLSTVFGKCDDGLLSALGRACGEVSVNESVRYRHGDDESHHPAVPPDAVAFASSTEEVQAIVRVCAEKHVPVIPFGTGTSLEGHICADFGGVCLDLSRMNQVLEVNAEDLDAKVQAGVTRLQLNRELRHSGLGFMVDPGADASIGGMAACGASGTAAVRYGTMRETVLGLTAVTASGEVIRTGTRGRKSSAGYDLTRLLIGSEGTLGVITEVQVKLYPLPFSVVAAVVAFDSLRGAASAATSMLNQSGIPLAKCELLDGTTMAAFNAYARDVPNIKEVPHLFLEFHGLSDTSVQEHVDVAAAVCREHGGEEFQFASSEEERNKLWAARHNTYYAALGLRPPTPEHPFPSRGVITDACVPLTKLADVMEATARDVKESQVVGPIFGHAGDGNFHCILVVRGGSGSGGGCGSGTGGGSGERRRSSSTASSSSSCNEDPAYAAAVEGVNGRLIEATLEAGGTCTGEHGVGSGKKKHLEAQYGKAAVDVMRTIKRSLDPMNILNPGKVVDV